MLFQRKNIAYLIDTENVGSTWINLFKENKKMDLFIFVTRNAKNLNYSLLREITNSLNDNSYKIFDCEVGRNSLDFYLSSYLGYLIGRNSNSSYVIVSQDKGYDHIIDFWKEQGIEVTRIDTKGTTSSKRTFLKRAFNKKRNFNKPKLEEVKTEIIQEEKVEETPVVKEEGKKVEQKKKTQPRKKPQPKKEKVNEVSKSTNTSLTQEEYLKTFLKDKDENEIKEIKKIINSAKSKSNKDVYENLVKHLKQEQGQLVYKEIKGHLRKYYSLSEEK